MGEGAPVIPILEVGPAMEPAVLEKLDGVDALVPSLPGGGHIADTTPDLLEAMAAKVPVVFASRAGETLTRSYGYPGGEIDLIRRGLIPAAWLDSRRARVALAILLSSRASRDEIAAFFGSL
jgi:L-asparaginase